MGLAEKIFGTHSQRELKRVQPIADQVFALEEKYKNMSEEELRGTTERLRGRLELGDTLDDILPDAFAACREASVRVLGQKPFPVQVIGGIVLHQGRIAEMKTGEGKTLTATMPAYLNALSGKGVHIVTVNDYLAKFQGEWMGRLYNYLGMSVGLILHDVPNDQRKKAYAADITYGTNNEFGFDYLRDNMVVQKAQMVQRGHNFAVVDEVDSILIDEARTPLIISGQAEEANEMYTLADNFAKRLRVVKIKEIDEKQDIEDTEEFANADFVVDEKHKSATLTANGIAKAEQTFNIENLSDPENSSLSHYINQAIRARGIMQRDIDYIVKDNEVIIVDEFTGRLMYGRRYNDGLHQAIEAKENVKVANESKTLATITFQNFFRLYNKLSGMTGTALTEEQEFRDIYALDVIEIPTNKPMIRQDHDDVLYKTQKAKYEAIVEQVIECHEKEQPVLVGTVSIEKSEIISGMLKRRGVKHEVLNAKHHEREAMIVAQAGKKGAVTIATNMAGRGTDIILGGNAEYMARNDMAKEGFEDEMIVNAISRSQTDDAEILAAREKYVGFLEKHKAEIADAAQEVITAGGLFIIGTERHESRRIDNQLRGRSGRQGDPGESRFFLSLDDDLMRLFGGERLTNMMETLKIPEDQPIEAGMFSRLIENSQKRVEERNFETRKSVLQFDDVMNRQREIIYGQRRSVLNGDDLKPVIENMIVECIESGVATFISDGESADWNIDGLRDHFRGWLCGDNDFKDLSPQELSKMGKQGFIDLLQKRADEEYAKREKIFGENMREVERILLLRNDDRQWMDHIDAMDDLKQGIYMRSYSQRDPVVEYRVEGFEMFDAMVALIREDTVRAILTVMPRPAAPMQRTQIAKPSEALHGEKMPKEKKAVTTVVNKGKKVGRNDPCPCGSGKKYKKCCGANEEGE